MIIKFKVDENLPREVTETLVAAGFDAISVVDQRLGGRPDLHVAKICRDEARAILTLDVDFADIRAYSPADYSGIVVLRLARIDKLRLVDVVRRLVPLFTQEPLSGRRWIVDESRVRVRE